MTEMATAGQDLFAQKRKAVLHGNKESHAKFTSLGQKFRRRLSQEEREAANKVPLNILAKEWLDQQKASLDTRSYLVEKLLPTLVIGLEKLLTEVTSRDLVDCAEPQDDFNPINFIAQYLMRNNPQYSNFAEAHPYCKTMRQVSEELKKIAYSLESSQLAELRIQSKQRCAVRAEEEEQRKVEENRKIKLLEDICEKWLQNEETAIRLVDMKLALQFWTEGVAEEDVKARLQESVTSLLSAVTSPTWERSEFIATILRFSEELSKDDFNVLVDNLDLWAEGRRENKQKEKRTELFASVFQACDSSGTNAIDRLRVLHLLDCYYDSLSSEKKTIVHNPRQWPIVDVVEAEELEEDKDFLLSQVSLAAISEEELMDFYEGGGVSASNSKTTSTSTGEADEVSAKSTMGSDDENEGNTAEVEGKEKGTEVEGEEKGSEVEGEKSEVEGEGKGSDEGKGSEAEGEGKVSEVEGKGSEVEGKGSEVEGKGSEVEGKGSEVEGKGSEVEGKGSEVEGEESEVEGEGKESEVDGKESGAEGRSEVEGGSEVKGEAEGKGSKAEGDEKRSEVEGEEKSADVKGEGENEGVGKESVSIGSAQQASSAPKSLFERRLVAGKSRNVSLLRMREVCGMSSRPLTSSGPGAVWDHEQLNRAQFVHLVELFVGRHPDQTIVQGIADYIQENYMMAKQERDEQRDHAQEHAVLLSKRRRTNLLFDTWDNDSSGFLELEELQLVLCQWREFSTEKAKEHAEKILQSLGTFNRLTRSQFQLYIDELTEDMGTEECSQFFDFLITNVKRTFEEKHRGEKRKEFLAQIIQSAKNSGLNFLAAAKEAVSILHQDIEQFGDNKYVTVLISMLECCAQENDSHTNCLTVKAASPSIESRVIQAKLKQSSPEGVGFKVVVSGMPVHVLSIRKHGRLAFFLPEHKSFKFDGSLAVVPIVTPQHAVLGTISIDSLQPFPTDSKTTFYAHETHFLQGVGLCLGEVHHWISVHQKLLKVAESALNWLHRRCVGISKGEVYLAVPMQQGEVPKQRNKEEEGGGLYKLCLMLSTSQSEPATEDINKMIRPNENLFLTYLFECVENSEPVSSTLYGQNHLAYPIRDHTGCAVAVVDLTMPSSQQLTSHQLQEVTKVLKLLTSAFYKLSSAPKSTEEGGAVEEESSSGDGGVAGTGDGEGVTGTDSSTVMFDQLMLDDLRDKVKRINSKLFAELRSYMDPPPTVLQVIQALLYIIYPEQNFESWMECKQKITITLVKALETYDPLQVKHHPKLVLIKQLIDFPVMSLHEHGSLPAKYIYNWVLVCVALLEYSSISASITTIPPPSTHSIPPHPTPVPSDHTHQTPIPQ